MSERGHIPESRQREKPRADLQWIGKSMKRVEDPRLLVGKGVYADDVNVPEMAHAAVLRSPHAHARIVSIDVSKAQALPGVPLRDDRRRRGASLRPAPHLGEPAGAPIGDRP